MLPRAMSSRRPFVGNLAVARVGSNTIVCGRVMLMMMGVTPGYVLNTHPKREPRQCKTGDSAGPLPLTSRAQQGQLVKSYDGSGASIALAATRACCVH